jgi:TPR repeat protein
MSSRCEINRFGCVFYRLGRGGNWKLELAAAAYARGDYVTVAKLLRPLADQGNAAAQANVGLMYATGPPSGV